MGMFKFKKYSSGFQGTYQINNAPDPKDWRIMSKKQFTNAYMLKVHYPGCTKFSGIKIMVFLGSYLLNARAELDPHFDDSIDSISPIARFKPDNNGYMLACKLAESL